VKDHINLLHSSSISLSSNSCVGCNYKSDFISLSSETACGLLVLFVFVFYLSLPCFYGLLYVEIHCDMDVMYVEQKLVLNQIQALT
jgi:hypothetical protein